MRAEVHVLTLSATPIPRTLQLALTGVRDLSIIASPPVDRLAVRTFVAPHDPLMIREALLRERYRGGQAFYVVPRIEDLAGVKDFLDKNVPEMKVAVAHGQMPPTVIEDIMSAFYDGKYDILLSTTIIESGLDIPTANTLIVHRADMFGLAQLYQLRGRVGRSKLRAYALFTLPAQQKITAQAERRLKVLQSLETLGAGFQLASHDLDIRGAGNLLGEEQSGHIKEVGFELYQSMLEEAILNLKAGVVEPAADRWSPQITVGMPVLIPEDYVADLSVRLSLYRRLADLDTDDEIDNFAAELRDRFGVLPDEVRYLFKIAAIKGYCRRANVEKVDAGPKGAVITLPRQQVRAAGSAGLLHPPARPGGQGAAGHEGGVLPGMGDAGRAPDTAPPKSCASSPISPRTARRRDWRFDEPPTSLRAKRSNPATQSEAWIASSLAPAIERAFARRWLLAMTSLTLRRGAAGFLVEPRQQRFRRIRRQHGRDRHGRLRSRCRVCRGWCAASRCKAAARSCGRCADRSRRTPR